MSSETPSPRQTWLLSGLVIFTFFFLLGTRGLNEPDEGRYGEIAREMVETGDWLVPHIWYVPHLDKPPMTYWLVGLSLKFLGVNEWALRLPLALAGLSGAWLVWLFGMSLGGRRVATWSVLVLATSTLYFAMARMLTTDIFLTQFIGWAIYFFWRSWRSLDDLGSKDEDSRGAAAKRFFYWQTASWVMLAGGFLTKGPIALLIPGVTIGALLFYRRKQPGRRSLFVLSTTTGVMIFAVIALPWFLTVFQTVPKSFDFMVRGQVVAHAMGAAAKNRGGPMYYFIPILIGGFLPWTPLLGWLWRKAHWRQMPEKQKDGWLLLSVWSVFTFIFFSINSSKLPAYILPMFPALAVLTALRWFRDVQEAPIPPVVWRSVMLGPLLAMAAIPLVYRYAFKINDQDWMLWQAGGALAALGVLAMTGRNWSANRCAQAAVFVGLLNLYSIVAVVPIVETQLRSNQTLKPLAVALQKEYRAGDTMLCWKRLPQGLPFYAYPTINSTNRPTFAGLPLNRIPFEFPGNVERLDQHLLTNDVDVVQLLAGPQRVLVIGFEGSFEQAQKANTNKALRLINRTGQWELFANQ